MSDQPQWSRSMNRTNYSPQQGLWHTAPEPLLGRYLHCPTPCLRSWKNSSWNTSRPPSRTGTPLGAPGCSSLPRWSTPAIVPHRPRMVPTACWEWKRYGRELLSSRFWRATSCSPPMSQKNIALVLSLGTSRGCSNSCLRLSRSSRRSTFHPPSRTSTAPSARHYSSPRRWSKSVTAPPRRTMGLRACPA